MMRIALCLIKRLGWWCEDMQSFKNYYLVGRVPLKLYREKLDNANFLPALPHPEKWLL